MEEQNSLAMRGEKDQKAEDSEEDGIEENDKERGWQTTERFDEYWKGEEMELAKIKGKVMYWLQNT